MSKGGKREGAGRPKKLEGVRTQRQLRAYDDEWELIKRFARILKHEGKDNCIKALEILDNVKTT